MATAVTMPKLGLTMTKGMVAKWLIRDGQEAQQGQPVVVVMSAKITYQVEAPASGVLRIVAQPQETRLVGEAIGFVLEPGEALPEIATAVPPGVPAQAEQPPPPRLAAPVERSRAVRSSPAARRLARELGIDIARVPGTGREGRISEGDVQCFYDALAQATPLARRMAEEEGLDLTQIPGTGPDGRITEDDVLRALEGPVLRPTLRWGVEGPVLSAIEGPAPLPKVIPLTDVRQVIAERMLDSLHSMAQLTLTAKADVSALVGLRDVLRQRWDTPISYTDLIVKATAVALREHPLLNSTLVGQEFVLHDQIHIGVAVALAEGLIVPVIRQADVKSLLQIHRILQDLAGRARSGALSVDEVTGSTFTVTNLGMYGVETFTPIINPPEAAILGVGRIAEELALANGQVVAHSVMTLNLTIDHRIVDGAPGGAFLQTLVQLLEHPALIFVAGEA